MAGSVEDAEKGSGGEGTYNHAAHRIQIWLRVRSKVSRGNEAVEASVLTPLQLATTCRHENT